MTHTEFKQARQTLGLSTREFAEMLETDSLLLEKVLDYWVWPCICTPTTNESEAIERHRLEGLGYIR